MTTIADLLFEEPDRAAGILQDRLIDLKVATGLPAAVANVPNLPGQVADAVAGFLQMPVDDLIASAWHGLRAVQDACRQTRGKRGAAVQVALIEQTLKLTQRPKIRIDVASEHFVVLELVLSVTLHIESATVHVLEGQIIGYGAGNASSTAELGIARPDGEPRALVRKEVLRLVLPSVTVAQSTTRPTL
jgi:hypothetical protein